MSTTTAPRPTVAGLVERPRLFALLDRGASAPVTLICAPAGSGKTVLLSSWLRGAQHPVAWVGVERDEADATRFWTTVIDALRGAGAIAPDDPLATLVPAPLVNLLSVGAAYSILTAVFQEGHGATAIGLDGAIPIVSYVPMMMFAILFGLAMDYQVFLLSRVREEVDAGTSPRQAVIAGLAGTGKVIASAAAIMVAVFASFILNGDPTVKEFGVGLASAIFIAGAMVCVLLPAVMLLMGRHTWWLPRRLDRVLPHMQHA